ncbi:hypothetical protein [Ahniella affigens]|nr:hypothetical protein [Ahniella affigens]
MCGRLDRYERYSMMINSLSRDNNSAHDRMHLIELTVADALSGHGNYYG